MDARTARCAALRVRARSVDLRWFAATYCPGREGLINICVDRGHVTALPKELSSQAHLFSLHYTR